MLSEKKRFKVGASASFVALSEIARTLGTTPEAAKGLCDRLGVPILHLPGHQDSYVLLYAIETALFTLGLPRPLKEDPALVAAHQELAGTLYGTLTIEALKKRVSLIADALTKSKKKTKMKKRSPLAWKSWTGRRPK